MDFNRIGIIGAMDEEVDILAKEMKIEKVVEAAGLKLIHGKLANKDVVLVRCGIAKVNAALCTQLLIDKFDVDCIINTGVAGALHEDLDVNDLVISTEAIQYDVDSSDYGDPVGTIPRMETSVFPADERLINFARESAEELEGTNFLLGRICTGDRFVGQKSFKEKLRKEFNGYCCEMEGGAVAHVCYLNKKPYVIIRSISDKADGHAPKTFDNFVNDACKVSRSIILKMLKKI